MESIVPMEPHKDILDGLAAKGRLRALSRNSDRIRWYFEVANGEISYAEYSRRMVWSHFFRSGQEG